MGALNNTPGNVISRTRVIKPSESAVRILARALPLNLRSPCPQMQACVVVPARNEESGLRTLVAALARQRDSQDNRLAADSYEVILLLNNCTDGTPRLARRLQREFPRLTLHFAEVDFPTGLAHVGRARQALFDFAFERFHSLRRLSGLILTTDADSEPSDTWIADNLSAISAGADGVGGRILLYRHELAALPVSVRRFVLLDIGYRRALEELRALYAPEAHDPFPRHHQHFGGSLAVTAEAYVRAGGMPLRQNNEDVALFQAIAATGGRFRHSYQVKVWTSARMTGRARNGLADALVWWQEQALNAVPVIVESASAAEARLARIGLRRSVEPHAVTLPSFPPDPPEPAAQAEIHETLCELRERLELLRGLPLAARLDRARLLHLGSAEKEEAAA